MRVTIISILLGLAAVYAPNVDADELTAEQITQNMKVVGYVMANRSAIKGVDKACGKYVSGIIKAWDSRNNIALVKMQKLKNHAFKVIAEHDGAQAVERLKSKISNSMNKLVDNTAGKMNSLVEDQKKQKCEEFKQTVMNGRWDVKKNQTVYNFLLKQ